MTNNLNEKLEELNSKIDIWIDDEYYNSVYDYTTGIKPNDGKLLNHDQTVEFYINTCFPEINGEQKEQEEYCAQDKDGDWRQALKYELDTLPVTKVGSEDLNSDKHKRNPLAKYWSHLFYAKLLRAKIKQKGNDCYTRRLDDVAAYLERHLPKHTKGEDSEQEEWVTRLTLIYLMELSAVSMDWESLGYSERARRVIRDRKYRLTLKYKRCKEDKEKKKAKEAREKAPYEFYELWARFNIGVAYFHKTYYREAVLEFNQIIWQVKRWEDDRENGNDKKKDEAKECLIFFSDAKDKAYKGRELLLLPAKLYRAEVQLKLQFAYHTIGTLQNCGPLSEQKQTRAQIINAEAYQQLGRLGESWGVFEKAGDSLGCGQLGQRTEWVIPKSDELNQRFPSLWERFIDLLIADHLNWLKREGEDEWINKEDDLELRYIVKNGSTKDGNPVTAEDYKEAVDNAESYLKILANAFSTYHDVVKHHAYNRSGYFQQLAKYLGWLAEASDYEYSAPAFVQSKDVKSARKQIADITKKLYYDDNDNRVGLLEEEPGLDDEGEKKKEAADRKENECLYCDPKGIDLRRLGAEHYKWFTDDILKFFNPKSQTVKDVLDEKTIKKDKEDFVKRLLKREQIDKEDLRIRDLNLRYEYYKPEELFEHSAKFWKMRKNMKLCGKMPSLKDGEGFAGLLACAQGNKRNQEYYTSTDHLTSDDYIKLMQDWDKYYLRHLRSPSIHENHQKGGFYFMGLQRWNSASPAKGYSVGGGYLLYHLNKEKKEVDMGIAIDPGFDFVRNLFHMGFSLDDIDIVLISHAHLDHIRDFESIIILLSELKKSVKREKRVHVILSLGAYRRLKHIVEDPGFRYLLEPYIIDVDREIRDDYLEMLEFRFKPADDNKKHENSNRTANDGKKGNTKLIERFRAVLPTEGDPTDCLWARITPTRAYHDDKTNYSDSFGFKIELNEKVKKPDGEDEPVKFGYTGDTKWVYPDMPDPLKREGRKIEDIAEQYKECDVLLVHLGSLVGKDNTGELSFKQYNQCPSDDKKYRCEKLVREKDHPYLIGMLRLLSSYYNCVSKVNRTGKPLVLVSEFGEELRGTIRTDFIRRLREVYRRRLAFLPVDVGLNVQMSKVDSAQNDSHDNRCACKVWCVQCDRFVNIDDAEFELYGPDHALYCVCKTCRKTTPISVSQDRLRQLYEVGLELRNNDNK